MQKIKTSILTILVVIYAGFISAMHKPISRLVNMKFELPWGIYNFKQISIEVSLIFLVFVLAYIVFIGIKGTRRLVTILYFILLAEILFFIYSVLSLHPVEVAHFVNYASIAIMLGLIWDRKKEKFLFVKILVVVFFIGAVDEITFQYYIGPRQKYLDFTDIYLNFIGAITGLMFYYGFKEPKVKYETDKPIYKSNSFLVFTSLVIIISFLFLIGVFKVSPDAIIKHGPYLIDKNHFTIYLERIPGIIGGFMKHHSFDRYYYVPTAIEALIVSIVTGVLFSTYDPRFIERIKNLFKRKSQ